MNLFDQFIDHLETEKLFNRNHRLLLAVSGGVDSVVLCKLCHLGGFKFSIAHANFMLRGEDSDGDENFVKTLAFDYRAPFYVKKFQTKIESERLGISIQETARLLRYEWFYQILQQQNNPPSPAYDFLLTAHHADDNVETVLINFFRGTGIQGLRGILSKKDKTVRPLLPFSKASLMEFAKHYQLKWVEDKSNVDNKYTRNAVRNIVIPAIRNVFPEFASNVRNSITRFKGVQELYDQAISHHKKKLLEERGNEWHIPVMKLMKCEPLDTIIYEIIREFNFSSKQVPEVSHLLVSDTGRFVQSSSHRILRNRNWLIISPLETQEAHHILVDRPDREITLRLNSTEKLTTLSIQKVSKPDKFQMDENIAWLDSDLIQFPLLIRPWKAGDYFYPLGMQKKKKLARFLIDQKLSKNDKQHVWVIEMNKKILWVVGLRIDDRFKISPSTSNVLKFTLKRQ